MRKFFALLVCGMLVSTAANAEKLFAEVASGANGNQKVTLSVDDNYNATITLPEKGKFDPSLFTVAVRNANHDLKKAVDGGTTTLIDLQEYAPAAYIFEGCTFNIDTKINNAPVSVTYEVVGNGTTIVATTKDATKVHDLWVAFKDKLTRGEQSESNTFVTIAAGSKVISYDEEAAFAKDVTLFDGPWTIAGTIGLLAQAEVTKIDPVRYDKVIVKAGTMVAIKTQLAILNEDVTLTLNYPESVEVSGGRLSDIKKAMITGTSSEIVKNTVTELFAFLNDEIMLVDGETISASAVVGEEPTGLNKVAEKTTSTKRMINGQLVIDANGQLFNAQGVAL